MFPILDASSLSPEAGWGANEVIQVIPAELSTEDVMRIWDALDPSYRLSVSYIARLVRLDPDAQRLGRPVVTTQLRLRRGGAAMTFALRERVEARVLGALRLVDATTLAPIDDPLMVSAPGARLCATAPACMSSTAGPVSPRTGRLRRAAGGAGRGSESLVLDVRDPAATLSRTARRPLRCLAIAKPANAEQSGSLFRAVDVPMYPSASAPLGANWVELRATVRDTATGDGLGGALLRVVTAAGVLARGMTDRRGEALVAGRRRAGHDLVGRSPAPSSSPRSPGSLECYFDACAGHPHDRPRTCARNARRARSAAGGSRRPSRTDAPACRSRLFRSCSPPAAR